MPKRVADLLVDVLLEAGVQRVYGGSGDSLNGITDSSLRLSSEPRSRPCHCRSDPEERNRQRIFSGDSSGVSSLTAYHQDLSLREAALKLGFLTASSLMHGFAPGR